MYQTFEGDLTATLACEHQTLPIGITEPSRQRYCVGCITEQLLTVCAYDYEHGCLFPAYYLIPSSVG